MDQSLIYESVVLHSHTNIEGKYKAAKRTDYSTNDESPTSEIAHPEPSKSQFISKLLLPLSHYTNKRPSRLLDTRTESVITIAEMKARLAARQAKHEAGKENSA